MRWPRVAAAGGLVVALASPAAADAPGYVDSAFLLRLQAAAVSPEVVMREAAAPGAGFASVRLRKEPGAEYGECASVGAGVFEGSLPQQLALENGGPPDAHDPYRRGSLDNPTVNRDVKPNLSPGVPLERRPRLDTLARDNRRYFADLTRDGTAVHWGAFCDSDAAGHATAANGEVGGAETAGSAVEGRLDKLTGRYVGTARAYAAGVRSAAGTLDLVSSVMSVKHLPGRQPTVSYRLGVTAGSASSVLASGTDVPVAELASQFNRSARTNAAALASLGPLGLTLMAPTVSPSDRWDATVVHAPFLELTAGLAAREGALGQNTHTRLVTISYEGENG